MGTHIVLVEGFPGCGKSTTAQWLVRLFRAEGHGAEWFYEEQRPHPLSTTTPGTDSSWLEYFSGRLRRWRDLAEQAVSSDTVKILESAWLQVPLFLMLRQDLAPDVIRGFVHKAVDAMASANPVLIYLSQPEPELGMKRLFDRRGMAWALSHAARSDASHFCRNRDVSGIDGLLHYWREHNTVSEAIVREAAMPMLFLDPRDGDWHQRRTAIAGFLGRTAHVEEPRLDEADLSRLVGEYQGAGRRFTISLQGAALVLDGLLWPGNRLVPLAPRVFEPESWPLVLRFTELDGEIRAVQIEGPFVAGRQLAGDYERVR
jgi:hypothetical protein